MDLLVSFFFLIILPSLLFVVFLSSVGAIALRSYEFDVLCVIHEVKVYIPYHTTKYIFVARENHEGFLRGLLRFEPDVVAGWVGHMPAR